MQDRAWLWKQCIEPWKALERQGTGVMVGEWGVFNRTPHDVVLRWAEDCLANWQKAGWGWAMWNFRGSMGVMDSGRSDIRYENFEGHKLDRKLMDLLQRDRDAARWQRFPKHWRLQSSTTRPAGCRLPSRYIGRYSRRSRIRPMRCICSA